MASVILNFVKVSSLDKMQPSIEFNSRWVLQLINAINDLQELLKYFNGTTTFIFFTKLFSPAASAVFPTRAALYLNDLELKKLLLPTVKSALLAGGSSVLKCHKHPGVSE